MERAEILDEIRRLAEVDGTPPGQTRFESETGVIPSEWLGRYWARWGDALVEAGFAPNKWKERTDPTEVLGALATMVQELGRFPTKPERQMRRRSDLSFPSDAVFRRLGSKAKLAGMMVEYCADDTSLASVKAVCEAVAQEPRREAAGGAGSEGESTSVDGYVYLFKSGGSYKIGRSNSAGRRAYELAIQLPEKLELVHQIKTDDPVGIERYWHRRFEAKRQNGEFFKLDASDVRAFRRRKQFM